MAETVVGLNKLLEQFKDLKNLDIQQSLEAGGYVLMDEAILNTSGDWPMVRTGNLLNSYSVKKNEDGGVSLINSADYAFMIEYGTEKIAPRGMVRRALDSKNKEILDAIKNNLEKQIKSVGG